MRSNEKNVTELNAKLIKLLNSYSGKVDHGELLYILLQYATESAIHCNPKDPIKLIEKTAEHVRKVMEKQYVENMK